MDPNANLEEMLKLVEAIRTRADEKESGAVNEGEVDYINMQIADDAERLAELVQAMNEWITKGGFLPSAWKRS